MSTKSVEVKCKHYSNEINEKLLEVQVSATGQPSYWIYITNQGVQHDISGSTRIPGEWRVHCNSRFYRHIVFGESEYSHHGRGDTECEITKVLEIMRASFPGLLYSDIERWNREIEQMYMEYVL